jgi:plastocyanin
MKRLAIIVSILLGVGLFAARATAGDLVVQVRTTAGAPVADAVVTVYPASGAGGPIHFDWPMTMSQQNIAFHPFVLIAPVGATVSFPNFDPVRHHVYSFSPTHQFELKLYGKDQTRSVTFDKAGVVALGCNIHDKMAAFIKVVDTPYAAKTDANGQLVIHGLPPGPATMHLWRPYMKTPGNEIVKAIAVPGAGQLAEAFAVEVHPPAAMQGM